MAHEELARQSDPDLLARFAADNDQAAFAALLKRHGALVLSVCRRILQDRDLAEDAFQAVFIILAKRARAIRKREALASWLFGVAQRVSWQERRRRGRERRRLLQAAAAREQTATKDLRWQEMLALLDDELRRLPCCYQAPLLACYLEGRTQDEAARELGWPIGTLRRRLEKGREFLKARLVRQGIAWSAGLAALGFGAGAADAVCANLRDRALQSASAYLKGESINQGVALMVQGGLRWSAGTAWTTLVAGLVVGCTLAGLGTLWGWAGTPDPDKKEPIQAQLLSPPHDEPPAAPAQEKDRTLPEGAVARLGTMHFNHGDGLSSLHYTPDGKSVVSCGGGVIRVWNAETGAELKEISTTKRTTEAETVLLADGKTLLALFQHSDTLETWDISEGKQTRTIDLQMRRGLTSKNALSPDGRLAALATAQGVAVHETAEGVLRFRTNKRGDMVRAVIFSGNSKHLIQVDTSGVIEVWDVMTGMPHKIFDQAPPAHVVAVSSDGRFLATLEHHNHAIDKHLEKDVVHVWDLEQPKEIRRFTAAGWFMRLHFTPDSKRILASVSTGKGYSSHCWDIASGAELPNPPSNLGGALAFHPDGNRYVTGHRNRFDEWDLAVGKRVSSELSRFARANALAFDAKDEHVVSVGYDAITIWKAATGKRLRSFDVPFYQYYDPRPMVSSNGKLALTYQHGNKPYSIDMLLWDVASGKKTALPLGDPSKRYVNAQHHINPWFTPDGKQLIVWQPGADKLSAIRIWDLPSGKETKQIPQTVAGGWRNTTLLADGKTLVVADQQAVFIDVVTGKELLAWEPPVQVPSGKKAGIVKDGKLVGFAPDGPAWQSFAISADGKTAAYIVSGDDGSQRVAARIVVCDGRTGKLLHRLDDSGQRGPSFEKLLFSPDGRRLVNTARNVAHVWEVASGAKVRTLTGHRGDIEALAFSNSGRRLATASSDSTVLIWEIAEPMRK